ncbi:hypothetical protein [Bradyrhizobium manausense]|uniref:aspartate racemase/maleate isomerase family protein n=1 Tax=Bradyrhizobium manausense TaxID=989370 RepID=UPI00138F3428
MGEVSREAIFKASKELIRDRIPDALFVSCTAVRIVPYIEELEREIGIPVISSSQAMAWDALRLAGYSRSIEGYGQLLTLPR